MNPQAQRYAQFGLILAAVAVVYAVLALALPERGFWTTDGGNKFIVIQNLLTHGTADIAYPAVGSDPHGHFFPDGEFHFHKHPDGRMTSFYPPYYPFLCSLWMHGTGTNPVWLSVLSGLAAVAVSWLLIRRLTPESPPGLPLTALAFGTPFWFYSLVLWEHQFSIFWAILAMTLLVGETFTRSAPPRRAVYALAGLLLAVSCWFREESYLLFGAVGLALLVMRTPWRRLAWLGGGWAAAMLPLWWYQYAVYGHILGLHALGYRALAQLKPVTPGWDALLEKTSNFYVFLFKFAAGMPFPDPWAIGLILPFVALLAVGLLRPEKKLTKRLKLWLLPLAAGCSAILTIRIFRNPEPVLNTIFTQGLFPAVPLLAVAAAESRSLWREKPVFRLILLGWLFYTLTACWGLNQGELGLIWGPRHYLVWLPLLVPLAVHVLLRDEIASRRSRAGRLLLASGILLFLTSLALQVHGIIMLQGKKQASEKIVTELEKMPSPVVVTDVFWLGEECGAMFYEKQFMCVKGDEDLDELLAQLRQHGVKDFTLVLSTRPDYRRLSNAALQRLLDQANAGQPRQIVSPGAGFLGLLMTECRFKLKTASGRE